MKTTSEIILEIERRLNENAAIPNKHYTDMHLIESNALLNLLGWIKSEKEE